MGNFFNYDDGDMAFAISDNMAMSSDGDLLMRLSDNMALDMDSGEVYMTSSWLSEDEN